MFFVEGLLMLAGLIAAYLVPTGIAVARKHPNAGAIAALNILLGWTVLGWIISIIWAFTASSPLVWIGVTGNAPARFCPSRSRTRMLCST